MEGYLRLAGIGGGFYEADPVLGARHIPNATSRWRRACFDVPIRINSQGLRDVEHGLEKPLGTQRIAVLGDSMAEALQVPLEASFPRLLETMLNSRRGGPPAEVINFGVAGYGTDQEYLTLKTRGAPYQPDVVLLVFTILNDVRNNSPLLEGQLGSHPRPYFRLDARGQLVPIPFEIPQRDTAGTVGKIKTVLRPLRLYDVMVAWVRGRPSLRSFLARVGLLHEAPAPPPGGAGATVPSRRVDPAYLDFEVYRREPDPEWVEAWQVTEALVRAIRNEVEGMRARFLLVAIPGGVELATPDAVSKDFPAYTAEEYDLAAPRERLRRLADAAGMEYVSIFDVFADDLRTRNGVLTDLYFWCDGHLASRGHQLVAQAIAEGLRRPGAGPTPAQRETQRRRSAVSDGHRLAPAQTHGGRPAWHRESAGLRSRRGGESTGHPERAQGWVEVMPGDRRDPLAATRPEE
ncbi:MAG: SGNH/GDSL hydrolase family protein [Candidatus Methylomirabilales bacterium]